MEYSNIIKGKKGAVLLFAALLLPLLFAFAGLAFDLGNMYALHSRLQNSADASALAGAAVFDSRVDTESDHETSDRAAEKFLRLNNESLEGIKMDPPQVRLGSNDRYYYRVRLRQEVPYYILRYFRSVLGDYINISATAYAMIPFSRSGAGDGSESGGTPGYFDNLFTVVGDVKGLNSTQNPDIFDRYNLTTKEGVEKALAEKQRMEISSFYDGKILLGGNVVTNSFLFNSASKPDKDNGLNALNKDLTAYINKPDYDPDLRQSDISGYIAEAEKIARAGTTYQGSPNGSQNFRISDINGYGPAYNGYRYTNQNGGDFEVNTGLQGNSDEPFYVVVDKAANPKIHINGGVDTGRPVIYCYLGNAEVWITGASGATFHGMIYAPNAKVSINDDGWTFEGSIVANQLDLNTKGTYQHKNYLGGGSNIPGPGEDDNRNVILVLPPEGVVWDD